MLKTWHPNPETEIQLHPDQVLIIDRPPKGKEWARTYSFEDFFFRSYPLAKDLSTQYWVSKAIADLDPDPADSHPHFSKHLTLFQALPTLSPTEIESASFQTLRFSVPREFELRISLLGATLWDVDSHRISLQQPLNSLFFMGPDTVYSREYPSLERQAAIRNAFTELLSPFAEIDLSQIYPLIDYEKLLKVSWNFKYRSGQEFEEIVNQGGNIVFQGGRLGDKYSGGSKNLNIPAIRFYGKEAFPRSPLAKHFSTIRKRIQKACKGGNDFCLFPE